MIDHRVQDLLDEVGLATNPEDDVTIDGQDPVLGNRFPVGEAAAVALAAGGAALNDLWEMQTGRRQNVRVGVRRAAVSLRASGYMRVNGGPPPLGPADGNPVVDLYRCRDG